MKENVTHIRLIRESGKPVEAEYCSFKDENDFDEYDFITWAEANRIPVTGDWPDREVFAREEVEPVFIQTGRTSNGYGATGIEKLRLKAKQEEPKQECSHEPLVDTGVGYYHCGACDKGWKYDEWDKDNSEPKQEAKTAEEAANEHMSQFWGYRLTPAEIQAGKSTFIAGWEAAKQQYQQDERPISEKQLAYLWVTARGFERLSGFLNFLKRTEYPISPENQEQGGKITIALVRDLLSQVTRGDISFSRMVEILREFKPVVIIHKGAILNNCYFDSVSEARNYIKWRYPKKKWLEPFEDVLVCANHGTKFQILELSKPQAI